MLPEISEQLLFPIDINIYTLICLSSGGNKLEDSILYKYEWSSNETGVTKCTPSCGN